jgi:hypothetical protein
MPLSADAKKIRPCKEVPSCRKVSERTIYRRSQGKKTLSLNGGGMWPFLLKDIDTWIAKRPEYTEIAQ